MKNVLFTVKQIIKETFIVLREQYFDVEFKHEEKSNKLLPSLQNECSQLETVIKHSLTYL